MLRKVRLYTLAQAADRMDVSPRTVRSWVEHGHLAAYPLRRGRQCLYRETDLVEAERQNRAGRLRRRDVEAA